MRKNKAFRKFKRLELVELIYQMRKENIDLRKRCKELERQLSRAENMAAAYAGHSNDEQLQRIEELLMNIRQERQSEAAAE